jgi:hypothetical protein
MKQYDLVEQYDPHLAPHGKYFLNLLNQILFLLFSSRTITDPTNITTIDNPDFSNNGVGHVRLDRAIEIVIDSIQSLEGAVNNFDQLVFGLIYGRLSTRTELESIEVNEIKTNRFILH